ncbi:hypothetical protein M3P05_02845 [Sansalvadorimonas sp. 2012CJ34-2]|uniref:Chromosome partition protein Smc n=1 Tax=Parendozoicomonas callyspongiae TaxID=2942213 RepID=A0ABT0PEB2_9GAMM|nr:hypothetical protein [Sansalvadorimonas sp. 2012CJ34-2]MCL6268888.1 hypothetical protein [Sansalvadorimonas sp. 2012CJ34-2]
MANPVRESTSRNSLYAELSTAESTTESGSVTPAPGMSYHHSSESMFDHEIKDLFDRSVAHKPGALSWLEFFGTAALSVGGLIYAPAIVGAGLAGLTIKKGYDIWSGWSASKNSEQLKQELLNRERPPVLYSSQIMDLASKDEESWVEGQSEMVGLLQRGVNPEESLATAKLSSDVQSPDSSLNPVLHADIHSPLLISDREVEGEVSPEGAATAQTHKPDPSEVVVEDSSVSDQDIFDRLEKQTGKLQKDAEALRSERDRLLGLLKDAGQSLDRRDAKDKERQETSKHLDADMQKLRTQNEALQDSVKDYSSQLQAKTEFANSLKAELFEKEEQFDALQAEYNQVKNELDGLKRDAEKFVEDVDSRARNSIHEQQREVEHTKNILGKIVNQEDQSLTDDELKEIVVQLELHKHQSENWEKLCKSIGAPGIDLQNLVDNWKHQADAAQKWHDTIDPLRAAGLDISDDKFLSLVQNVVFAQQEARPVRKNAR